MFISSILTMSFSATKSSNIVLILAFVTYFFSLFYWNPQTKSLKGFKPLYKYSEKALSAKSHLNKSSSRISSRCVAMFNIGYGSNPKLKNEDISLTRATAKLVKAKEKFEQETEHYLPFTKSLVKLVDSTNNEKLKFTNGTRLQIMKGNLPYVPCSIRDYSNADFHECVKVRRERNQPLWIAYFGDSKARNLLFYLVNNTQSFMSWTIDGNYSFTEEFYFPYATTQHKKPVYVESTLGERLSLIGSHFGTFSAKNQPPIAADVLLEWLEESDSDRLPDLLIVDVNTSLSWGCFDAVRVSGVKRHVKMFFEGKIKQGRIVSDIMIKAASSYIDQVTLHGIRKSDIIFWDSTLPFNIASDLECQLLTNHNHSTVAAEASLGSKQLLPFMCNDIGHKTRATVHDETTILLNLACNSFLNHNADYCCTE